ncbi:Protein tyrosine phosphatase [Stackebrandtia soli]
MSFVGRTDDGGREPVPTGVGFASLRNFRDLGGHSTGDGRVVASGRLYRSDSLGKLSDDDWVRFLDLRVGTVIDLRYPWEIARNGRVREADGLRYVNLSIEHRPYDQAEIDPDVDPWRHLADRYAEVASDGVVEIRAVLETIADADEPVVFHCASGKDRTGLIAALVLTLLGVSDEDIVADYALTENASAGLVADWRAANPGRVLRWPGYGRAPADVMWHVLSDVAAGYGSMTGYVADGLGMDTADLAARLRARLLSD